MPIAKLSNLCLSPLKLAHLGLRMDWIANSLFPLGLMISPTIGARGYPFAAGHVLFVSSQALLIFDPWLIDRRNACKTEAFVKGNCNSRCYISGACLSALACSPKYTTFHCSGCGMGHVFDSGLPLWNLPGSAWLVFFEIVSLVYKISSLHFMRLDFCAAASHTCSFFSFIWGKLGIVADDLFIFLLFVFNGVIIWGNCLWPCFEKLFLQRIANEWDVKVCDSSVLCNPFESKGGIVTPSHTGLLQCVLHAVLLHCVLCFALTCTFLVVKHRLRTFLVVMATR